MVYLNGNPKEFLHQFVTMDETWIHYYTSESREGSKQWVKPGESAPKRPKMQQSAGKVVTSVFRDAHGVISLTTLRKEGRLLEHIMLHYWIDWLTKSGRNGHISKRKDSFSL